MRLNVNALVDEQVVGKFLIVVAEEAGIDQLVEKLQRTLQRGGLSSSVERVLNSLKAVLPLDEALGDMLRDGEEIYVVLRNQDGQLRSDSQVQLPSIGYSGERAHPIVVQCAPAATVPVTVELSKGHLPQFQDDSDDEEDKAPKEAPYPPPPALMPSVYGSTQHVPGPSENFEREKYPYDVVQVDHPCDPIQPLTYDNDWLVESLTPNLREFVLEHFHEEFITEPKYVSSIGKFVGPRFYQASGSFISIFMRPQTAIGSDPSNTMPVHYNIAKSDLLTFQRKAESHINKAQQHMELFGATMQGLHNLLQKGMSETDHINEMLPHSYDAMEEVEGAMMEADRPLFPQIAGANPIIIIDTSGGVGEHLTFVKSALKRALHVHMFGKNSFQLVRFQASGGEPRLWMQHMVPATDDSLNSAETWIENLVPVTSARLTNGLRYALAHQECDVVYILSSGDVCRTQHEALLGHIRHINNREVPIHTVGVDPTHLGELLLRNISESNHGDTLLKSFKDGTNTPAYCADDTKWTSWRTNLVNEKSKQLSDSFKKPKMSIGSQIRIIEVMQREEKQKEDSWREEWKCTQRLLLSSETRKNSLIMERDAVKEIERRNARTMSARVGGGFMYATEELNVGLEHLFEHQSAVPWTANSDTAATGPRVPSGGAGQARAAKFPPSREMLPESVLPMPERRVRPRSSSFLSSQQGYRRAPGSNAAGNPWSATLDRTKRYPGGSPAGTGTPKARKHAGGGRAPSPGGGMRTASADRAAGDRQGPRDPSPKPSVGAARRGGGNRSRSSSRDRRATPTKARAPVVLPSITQPLPGSPVMVATTQSPSASLPLPHPRLERRWSF